MTIEYEGTRYRGWQSQKNTDKTVQGVLLRAARELLGDEDSAAARAEPMRACMRSRSWRTSRRNNVLPEREIARG